VIISIEKADISIKKVIISIEKLNISIKKTKISIEKMKKLIVFALFLRSSLQRISRKPFNFNVYSCNYTFC